MFSGYILQLLNEGIDLSIPVTDGISKAYHVSPVTTKPFSFGTFTGSVSQGGAVNCTIMTFCPHAHGTHTEGIGHITPEAQSIYSLLKKPWAFAALITCPPQLLNGDYIITQLQIAQVLENAPFQAGFHPWAHEPIQALVIRTGLHYSKSHNFSGSNPPYFEPDSLSYLKEKGILHLLTDLPSVDKEIDDGKLASHKAFWNYPEAPRTEATITELIQVPQNLEDDIYLLGLHVAPIQMDAAPSRPVLYQIR